MPKKNFPKRRFKYMVKLSPGIHITQEPWLEILQPWIHKHCGGWREAYVLRRHGTRPNIIAICFNAESDAVLFRMTFADGVPNEFLRRAGHKDAMCKVIKD